MTAHPTSAPARGRPRTVRILRLARMILPAATFLLLLAAVLWLRPRAASYSGITLMLGLATPIVLATLAQMLVITIGDIDLSIGPFVSMVACIGATLLTGQPLLATALLGAALLGYVAAAVLIELRRLPSIVVTLGLSFVWTGCAVLLLPSAGGTAPAWLQAAMSYRPPFVPLPLAVAAVAGLALHWVVMRSSFGVLLRGAGGSIVAMRRADWSTLALRMALYGLAGLFGILSGLSLLGLATSADADIATRYTLLSIAGTILGGGEFTGGRVSPIGAVFGALTLALTGTLLTFLRISPDWQVGAQGGILIAVLALRLATGGADAGGRG